MNFWQEHQELWAQYREQRSRRGTDHLHPSQLPSRLLCEISSQGVTSRLIHGNKILPCQYNSSSSYEESWKITTRLIQSARLKPGAGVVLYLWPPVIKISAIMVGPGQRAASAQVLDEMVQVCPEAFTLDPTHCYRVLDNGTKKVDLLSVSNQYFESITSALPMGVSIARNLASLAALDALWPKLVTRLPDPTLICLLEGQRLHYFGVRKGEVIGLRVAGRNTLRDGNDLRNTLNSMQIDPPSALFVALTSERQDVEQLCREEAEKHHIPTSLTDRESLLAEFPSLNITPDTLPLPIALDSGHETARFARLSFRSVEESQVVPLNRREMTTLTWCGRFSTLALVASFFALAVSVGFLFYQRQSPAWKVDAGEVRRLAAEWETYRQQQKLYLDMRKQLEGIPRTDRLLADLCAPAPEGLRIERLKFSRLISPVSHDRDGLQISGAGHSAANDLAAIKNYVQQLEARLAKDFPERAAAGDVTSTTQDPQGTSTRFEFSLAIR